MSLPVTRAPTQVPRVRIPTESVGRSGPSGKQRESIAVCALPILNLSSGRCRPHGSPWSPLRPTVSRPQCPFDLPLRRSPPPSRLLISSLVLLSPRPFPLTEYPTMSLSEGLSMSTQIFPTLHIPVTDSHSDTQQHKSPGNKLTRAKLSEIHFPKSSLRGSTMCDGPLVSHMSTAIQAAETPKPSVVLTFTRKKRVHMRTRELAAGQVCNES